MTLTSRVTVGHRPAPGGRIVPISRLELASGWLFGPAPVTLPERRPGRGSPAAALAGLERAVVAARGSANCLVAFSGGRDSSAVLAVATQAARRHGLPDPIPVTDYYPGAPQTEESSWQESVVRFLGLKEWLRRDATDDSDLLGPVGQDLLRRHGVVWPPTIASTVSLWAQATGGVLLTGEGGDAVFEAHRAGALLRLVQRPFPPDRRRLRLAVHAIAPAARRRQAARCRNAAMWAWLTPAARAETATAAAAASEAAEPLHAFRAILNEWGCRAIATGIHNMAVVAGEHATVLAHPLVEGQFLAELAPVVGRLGFPDRASFMRAVFGPLLPAGALERRTKAEFGAAYFGAACRQFAATWDGSGVDTDLVDVEALRQVWAGPDIPFGTYMLLQQAWLARSGGASAS